MPERAPLVATHRQSDAPSNAASAPSSARGAPPSQSASAPRPRESEHFARYLHQLAVASLPLSQRGDPAEQEADALADKMMEATPATDAVAAGDGDEQALPHELKQSWQRTTGHDWSGVRLHTGPDAARFAESVHAKAATHGRDVYFARGRFSPQTRVGQRLIAHEAAHALLHAERPVVHREEESTPDAPATGDAVAERARELAAQTDDANLATILLSFVRQSRFRIVSLTLDNIAAERRALLGQKLAAVMTPEDLVNLQGDPRGKLILNEMGAAGAESPNAPAQSVMPPPSVPPQAKKHHRHHHKIQQSTAEPDSDAQAPEAQAPEAHPPDDQAPEADNTPAQPEQSGAPQQGSNDSTAPSPGAGSTAADAAVFNQAIEAIQHVKPSSNASGLYTLSFQGRDVTLTEAQLSVLRGKVAESIRQGLMNLRTRVDAAIGYYHEQNNALHENPLFGSASRALAEGQDPFAQMMAAQDQIHQYEKAAYAGLVDPSHKLAEGAAAFEKMEEAVNSFGQLVVYNTDRLVAGGKRGEDLAREVKGRAEFTLGLLSTLTGVGGALALAAPMLDVVAEQASRAAIGMDVQWMEAATDLVVQVILAWLGAKFPMKKLNVGPLSRNLRQLVIQAFKMLVNGGATVVEFRVQAMAQILLSSFPAAVRGKLTEKDKQEIWNRLDEAATSKDFTDAILMSLAHETHAQFHPSEHAPERERKPAKEGNDEPSEKKQPDGTESSPESAAGKTHSDAELVRALGPAAERVTFERVEPGNARSGDPVGRGVDVNFQFNKKTGLIEKITVRAGELATPEDIQRHLPAIRVCETFSGLHGRVRNLITRLSSAIGLKVRSTEEQLQHSISVEEVYKLSNTIEGYRGEIQALQGEMTPKKQAQIELLNAHLESARRQLEKFEAIVAGKAALSSDSYNKETGEGQISAKGVAKKNARAAEPEATRLSSEPIEIGGPPQDEPPAKKPPSAPSAPKAASDPQATPEPPAKEASSQETPAEASSGTRKAENEGPDATLPKATAAQVTVIDRMAESARLVPKQLADAGKYVEAANNAIAASTPEAAADMSELSGTLAHAHQQAVPPGLPDKLSAVKTGAQLPMDKAEAVKSELESEFPMKSALEQAKKKRQGVTTTDANRKTLEIVDKQIQQAEKNVVWADENRKSLVQDLDHRLNYARTVEKNAAQAETGAESAQKARTKVKSADPAAESAVSKKGESGKTEDFQAKQSSEAAESRARILAKYENTQFSELPKWPGYKKWVDARGAHIERLEVSDSYPELTVRNNVVVEADETIHVHADRGPAENVPIDPKFDAARDTMWKERQDAVKDRNTAWEKEDAARSQAAAARAAGDEAGARKLESEADAYEAAGMEAQKRVVKQSQALGEHAGEVYIRTAYPGVEPKALFGVPSKGAVPGEFDQVWLIPGKAPGGGDLIVIIEAKGGSSELGSLVTKDGLRVQQGTPEYVAEITDKMHKKAPDVVEKIREAQQKPGALQYLEVRAEIDVVDKQQELGGIAVRDFRGITVQGPVQP